MTPRCSFATRHLTLLVLTLAVLMAMLTVAAGRAWLGGPGCADHGCADHRPQVGVHCASKPIGYWAFELCVNQNATQVIPDPDPDPDPDH